MHKKSGFTIIELSLVIVVAILATVLFVTQKEDINRHMRDQQRKAAVNSLYFQLKDAFYPNNKYYPETINPDSLVGVDPEIFTDPGGKNLGEEGSDYIYTSSNCQDNRCQDFELKARLEQEADFTRASRS